MPSGSTLVLSASIAALAFGASARAQTPVPDGRPQPGVRIHYDALGVPHVFAASDTGVFRGLGYTQVRDFPVATLANLWSATGRFAEVAGELVLARDERLRQWGFDRRAAELASEPAELEPTVRAWLLAYVEGVNAARREWRAHPEWIDALAGEGGAELGFHPVPAWMHPQRVQGSQRARLARLFEAEIGLEHVLAQGLSLAAGPDFGGGGYSTATNVWMMRGSERDPRVRLLADVHQPLQDFGYRSYPVQLAGPSYDVVGNSVPGFPCIALGASRSLAFASMTLPKKPRELAAAGLPFRVDERTPLAHGAWTARLEATEPARFTRGEESVPLIERVVTLRYWDTEQNTLRDDPRGPITLRWVQEGGFELPVTEPGPRQSLALATRPTVRYEARSFFGQRSLFETWIRLALCTRVGSQEGGIDDVLAKECLTTGRGQIVLACDAAGGFEVLWSARAPVLSAAGLARWREDRGAAPFDGHDPEHRWRGFHGFADLPKCVEALPFGERPRAWIACNSSPQFFDESLRGLAFGGPPTVYDGEPWLNRRQARARELFELAASDGELARAELETMALDVQDQWARTSWPWLLALARGAEAPLSARARAFLEWADDFRFESPDGKPGSTAFLAHPLSQVTPFLVLLRDRYEDELIAAKPPSEALALAFDPLLGTTSPEAFLAEEHFGPNRRALRAGLEWVAELRALTLERKPGGLANTAYLHELADRTRDCAALFPAPWNEARYVRQAPEWGGLDALVALRWGQVNLCSLTPHRWSFDPVLTKPSQVEAWLASNLAPCTMEPPLPYYRKQPAVVFPIGGTHDTLFQMHRDGFLSYAKELVPRGADFLALAPVTFGSQVPFLAELVPGARPRVRVLPALGCTEIVVDLPGHGVRAADLFRPTALFALGVWSDLLTDEEALAASGPAVRTLVLD